MDNREFIQRCIVSSTAFTGHDGCLLIKELNEVGIFAVIYIIYALIQILSQNILYKRQKMERVKTLIINIIYTFLVNDKDLDNGKKLLAFKYEVKSKDGDEQITPMNVWIASMETTQDSENTESKLEVGPTPNTGKFEDNNSFI